MPMATVEIGVIISTANIQVIRILIKTGCNVVKKLLRVPYPSSNFKIRVPIQPAPAPTMVGDRIIFTEINFIPINMVRIKSPA